MDYEQLNKKLTVLELIERLKELYVTHGNIPVFVSGEYSEQPLTYGDVYVNEWTGKAQKNIRIVIVA